jgi:BirA family biotin operon repressor/biotin-[acetyl-CoA-carboxylase] ligase
VWLADAQTQGRGRTGKVWRSPARAGIYLTLAAPLTLNPLVWPRLSLVAGLAVADALERTAGLRTELKWPNDIGVWTDAGWQKLAGVLCERTSMGCCEAVWLCGIGLNVFAHDELPPGAVALESLVARLPARETLAAAVGLAVRDGVERFSQRRGQVDVWATDQRLAFRGDSVTLDLGQQDGHKRGTLLGVDETGALRLRIPTAAADHPGEPCVPLAVVAAHGERAWQAPVALDGET